MNSDVDGETVCVVEDVLFACVRYLKIIFTFTYYGEKQGLLVWFNFLPTGNEFTSNLQ